MTMVYLSTYDAGNKYLGWLISNPMNRFVKAVAFDFGHTLIDEHSVNREPRLMPGVREVLPRITRPMAVWANTRIMDEGKLRDLLQRAQILEFFSCVVTSVDAGFRKPHPEFFRFALARWAFAKEEILFVCNQLNTDVAGAGGYGI